MRAALAAYVLFVSGASAQAHQGCGPDSAPRLTVVASRAVFLFPYGAGDVVIRREAGRLVATDTVLADRLAMPMPIEPASGGPVPLRVSDEVEAALLPSAPVIARIRWPSFSRPDDVTVELRFASCGAAESAAARLRPIEGVRYVQLPMRVDPRTEPVAREFPRRPTGGDP